MCSSQCYSIIFRGWVTIKCNLWAVSPQKGGTTLSSHGHLQCIFNKWNDSMHSKSSKLSIDMTNRSNIS